MSLPSAPPLRDLNEALERARALLYEPSDAPDGPAGYLARLEELGALWLRARSLVEQACEHGSAPALAPLLSWLDHAMDAWPARLGEPAEPSRGGSPSSKSLQEAPNTLWGDAEVDADACRGYRPQVGRDLFLAPGRTERELSDLPVSARPHQGAPERAERPPWWPCVRAVYGVSLDVGPWFVERMSESGAVERVTCWYLYNNRFSGRSLGRLARASQTKLKVLSLSGNPLGDEGMVALCEAGACASLRALHLHNVGLTRVGARALGEAPFLPNVRALVLGGNDLDGEGLLDALGGGRAGALRQLFLLSAKLTPERARALFARLDLPSLTHLYLSGNPLGDEGARELARADALPSLRYVSLDGCRVEHSARLAKLRPGVDWAVGGGAVFLNTDEQERP